MNQTSLPEVQDTEIQMTRPQEAPPLPESAAPPAEEASPPPASAEPPAAPASGEAPPSAAADQPSPAIEETPAPASVEPAPTSDEASAVRARRTPFLDLLGNRDDYNNICVPLHNAAVRGDWGVAQLILEDRPELVRFSITENRDTLLHIAASTKQNRSVERFVDKLLDMMTDEELELQNHNGNTALCVAVAGGNVSIARAMVERNENLLDIPGNRDMMPLYIASLYGNYEMVIFLYERSQRMAGDFWTHQMRGWVLLRCVEVDFFDVALRIVTERPELATNGIVLEVLARKPYAFRGTKPRSLIRRFLHKTFYVMGHHVDAEKEGDAIILLRHVWENIVKLSRAEIDGILRGPADDKITDDKKLTTSKRQEEKATTSGKGKQEEEAATSGKGKQEEETTTSGKEKQDQKEQTSSTSTDRKYSSRVLFVAAETGNTEFVVELIRLYPDLMWKKNDNGQSIFHIAVLNRQEGVYNLLYEIGSMKDLITPLLDKQGNNMLHLVGKCPSKKRLQEVSGAALQMQRELLWFKEVKAMIPPSYRKRKNNLGEEPHELFTEEHKELAAASEKWMKNTASHCMVVAALIATIVFTAAFTIPGGFHQDTGIPVLLHKKTFIAFIVSDAISLTFASISILIFLSILTSRYAEQDFLESLPKKLVLGLTSLFFSIVAMMVAFGISFFTVYEKKLIWVPIAICAIAFLPGVLYGRLQYHLLWDIYRSTYGSKNNFKPRNLMFYYQNPTV